MSVMSTVGRRWNALSRAAKWSVLALVGLGLFFAVIDPLTKWGNDMSVESGRYAERLKELRDQAQGRSEATSELRRAVRVYGDVLPPGNLDERVRTASQRIDEILRENGAGDVDFSSRTPVALGRNTLPDFVADPTTQELRRVSFDISFTGTPERVIEIVGLLERVPEITLIADISLDRIDTRDARLVEVDLTPEVWGVARKGTN